jgi:hypothetical protein
MLYERRLRFVQYDDTVSGKLSLCDSGKHCRVRLEECSDEEEDGDSGSEEGVTKEDTSLRSVAGTDKKTTKDVKSNALEADQEVPNVLVRLVFHKIGTLFIIYNHCM